MAVETTETQVKIVAVREDGKKYSINADIPAFGSRTFRYIAWWKTQGAPPREGATLLATMEPTRRSSYYIKQGAIEDGPVDGSEPPWQVDWTMKAVRPIADGSGAEGLAVGNTVAAKPASAPPAVFLDGNLRYATDQQTINDRESIRMVLAHGGTGSDGIYTDMESVLAEAETVAAWLNNRLAVRLSGGMVGKAQAAGAVVTQVSEEPKAEPATEPQPEAPPNVKNMSDVIAWVKDMGWDKAAVIGVLNAAGYADSKTYLAENNNDVQGLARLLLAELAW